MIKSKDKDNTSHHPVQNTSITRKQAHTKMYLCLNLIGCKHIAISTLFQRNKRISISSS